MERVHVPMALGIAISEVTRMGGCYEHGEVKVRAKGNGYQTVFMDGANTCTKNFGSLFAVCEWLTNRDVSRTKHA